MTAQDILWSVAVFFAAILAGGLVTVSFAVIPAMWHLQPDDDFKVHKVFNPLPDYYVLQSLFASAFCVILIIILNTHLNDTQRALAYAGLALSVPVVLISLLGNRRFNLVVRTWEAPALPDNYEERRRRWDRWHWTRTVGSVLIALCYIIAAGPAS
jgi:hypothetical protein